MINKINSHLNAPLMQSLLPHNMIFTKYINIDFFLKNNKIMRYPYHNEIGYESQVVT